METTKNAIYKNIEYIHSLSPVPRFESGSKLVTLRQSAKFAVFTANVPALIDDVGIPQVAHHKQGESQIREHDGEQHSHGAEMIDSLLLCGHALAVDVIRVALRGIVVPTVVGIEGGDEFGPTRNGAFVLLTAPIAAGRPRLMATAVARRPQIVVVESVSNGVRQYEREREPDQEGGAPFVLERSGIIALFGFVGHVDAQSANHHQVDAQSDKVRRLAGSVGDGHPQEGEYECRPASGTDQCRDGQDDRAQGHDQRLFVLWFGFVITRGSEGCVDIPGILRIHDQRSVSVHD